MYNWGMKNLNSFFWVLICAISSVFSAETPMVGVVLNAENDDPVPNVQIKAKSGKVLAESSSQGKFDLMVESEKAIVVFSKEGYDDLELRLDEQEDPLAMEVTLTPNVKSLGTTQVTGEKRILAKSRVSMEALESIQGLQFDLNEHLSKMPGVSGQKEFSKEISYYGSRTEDLAVSIGALSIPHLRHVDIGFPGNTSVLNPSVFKDVRIHSQNEGGSLDAGLAGRVEYTPKTGDSAAFAGSARLGVIQKELVASGPMIGFDNFILSYRSLNAFTLEKFGEQFFSSSGSEEACDGTSCNKSEDGTDWKLESGDVYLHLASTDSSQNATRATLLYSWDDYRIDQALSRGAAINLGKDQVSIFEGEQTHTLFSWEGLGAEGFNYYLGYVKSENNKVFRDTARVDVGDNDELLGDKYFLDERYTIGVSDILSSSVAGARLTWGAEALRWIDDRNDGIHTKVLNAKGQAVAMAPTAQTDIARLNAHLKWRSAQSTQTFQLGAWADSEMNQLGPQAIFTTQRKKILPAGADLLGELAYQSAPRHQVENLTELNLGQEQNIHSNLGFTWLGEGHSLNAKVFGRYYMKPLGPIPEVFWMYQSAHEFYEAKVVGANLVYEWTQDPSYAWISNISSTYGTYDDKIQWEANRLLDMSNSLRVYPRNDSLLSFILTHKASIGAPTYQYQVYIYEEAYAERFPQLAGTYQVQNARTIDTYRTDFRLHLDLSAQADYLRLKNLRFYTEVNNIFSPFDFAGSQYLGGENTRQRGWTATRRDYADNNHKQLEPFWAPGMGLFVQLGFEGNFGG